MFGSLATAWMTNLAVSRVHFIQSVRTMVKAPARAKEWAMAVLIEPASPLTRVTLDEAEFLGRVGEMLG